MYQLIINTNTENPGKPESDRWENVDLGTATVALTYQANDLAELKSREVNRSNRIKLPRTAKNNRLFGLPSQPLSVTVAPYRYYDCRLYDDGVELFGPGAKLQLMDATSTSYEVCIKGSLFDFFESIKNLSLRELDTRAYDEAYDVENHPGRRIDYTPWNVAKVANTHEDDAVVFPLIDWDTANNANLTFSQPGLLENVYEEKTEEDYRIHIKSQYIFPAVKLSALIDAICLAQGYTLQLSPVVTGDDDQKYARAVVPVCSLNPGQREMERILEDKWIRMLYPANITARGKHFYFPPQYRKNITPDRNENDCCYRYTPAYSGTFTFMVFAGLLPVVVPRARLYIRYDVFSPRGEKIVTRASEIPLNNQPFYVTEDIELGGYFRFWIDYEVTNPLLASFSFSCYDFKPNGAIFPAHTFPVLENMPDMSQLDLLKAVCQLYAMVVSVDERNKRINTYTFNEVVDSVTKGEYLDWSGKLDDREHSSTFQWSSYGQRSHICYAEEEGAEGEKLQDSAYFTLDNHTLPADKTLFELPFATCEENSVCGLTMAKIRMVEGGDSSPDSITESKPKLLHVTTKENVKVRFKSKDPDSDRDNNKIVIANFSPLLIKVFIDNYYSSLAKHLLPRIRVFKEKFWFLPLDMQNFTHKRPIYLSKYGCCFYVNKVSNYQPGKLTEVELVAILPLL